MNWFYCRQLCKLTETNSHLLYDNDEDDACAKKRKKNSLLHRINLVIIYEEIAIFAQNGIS